jgi:DNA repair protein RadD
VDNYSAAGFNLVELLGVIPLRDFQQDVERRIYAAWQDGARNVLAALPTGAGKTVLFSKIMADQQRPSVAIAHRQELVGQISLALARNGVRHRIIGPRSVARACASLHLAETRRNYIDPTSPRAVAGVDTLVRMPAEPWMGQIGLWVTDEAHHLLRDNKWGKAASMFPNAHGLGVTATPCRADGCGLGRHADGLIDAMVVGLPMRALIDDGWLSEYRVFVPPSDLHLEDVTISAGGDYSPVPLRAAVHKSRITGDVVAHYKRIAMGKLGITFAVDVVAATEIAQAFRAAGVPAEVVSADTPDALRSHVLREFRARKVLQLVNVDIFNEGFDLPALEVVSMARPTQSYALYAQAFGRALRPLEGKDRAIIIDHVGNILRHGLPDAPRAWTLDRRERRSRGASDLPPLRVCLSCTGAYDRVLAACPYCGEAWVPAERSTPAQVDGDLTELLPEALLRLRGEIDKPLVVPYGAPPEVVGAVRKRHREAQEAQQALRSAMVEWAGRHSTATDAGTVSALQRRFYLEHGIDVLSAQALGRREADELRGRLCGM